MGVLQLGGQLDLAPEPLDVHAGGQLRQEHLDHDFPVQGALRRQEHARHPAAAELTL
jgi:hypothetical protein